MAMRYDEWIVYSPRAGSLDGIGHLRGEGAQFLSALERAEGLTGGVRPGVFVDRRTEPRRPRGKKKGA